MSKGTKIFPYRLTNQREEKIFELQKLLREIGEDKASNTKSKTIDKAFDISTTRINQILEDRRKLGL